MSDVGPPFDRGGRSPFISTRGGAVAGSPGRLERNYYSWTSRSDRAQVDQPELPQSAWIYSSRGGLSPVLTSRGGFSHRGRGTSSGGTRGTRRGFRYESELTFRPAHVATKHGSAGVKIKLRANYFELEKEPSWSLYQYRVFVTPHVDSLKLRNWLVKSAFVAVDCPIIYVGEDLYSSKKLEDDPSIHRILSPHDKDQVYKVEIQCLNQVEHGDYTYQFVYNELMRKFMLSMRLTEMGRCFYDKEKAIEIPQHKLTLIPGFITSIRDHEDQFLLCVDTTTKIIHQETVLDIIKRKISSSDTWRRDIEDLFVGFGVVTTYDDMTHMIASIEWNMTPNDPIPWNQKKTVAEHYKTAYGLDIADKSQPLLRAKLSEADLHRQGIRTSDPKSQVILVPEFCKMTGLSDKMRDQMRNEGSGVGLSLTKILADHYHTHAAPQKHVDLLNNFIHRLVNSPQVKRDLKEWSLGFETELSAVPGRVLDKQTIIFGRQEMQLANQQADWAGVFRTKQMYSVGELKSWTVIVPQCDATAVDNLIHTMGKVGGPLGLPVPPPQEIIKLPSVTVGAYTKALEKLQSKQNDLVLVVLPNDLSELYGLVKRNLTCLQGLVSHCVVSSVIKNKTQEIMKTIATKVVIEINAKLGGEPWTLRWPLKDMMVVGVDIYRGTKLTGGKNVVAMVASVSDTYGRYFSTVSMYETTDELSCAVVEGLIKCLDAYPQFNSGDKLPSKILIFRDGVGEGQVEVLYETELEQIKASLKTHYNQRGVQEPQLTFVVVNKRINTRLFTADSEVANNPPPGTVVDKVVTLSTRYDFYMIAHTAREGTVTPTAYNVMWDTQRLTPDQIQLLTFKFCHMYFNWTATVAVPAPCQYARKLAHFVAQTLGREPHPKLAYNLHFL